VPLLAVSLAYDADFRYGRIVGDERASTFDRPMLDFGAEQGAGPRQWDTRGSVEEGLRSGL
jgi:hypothetical protein